MVAFPRSPFHVDSSSTLQRMMSDLSAWSQVLCLFQSRKLNKNDDVIFLKETKPCRVCIQQKLGRQSPVLPNMLDSSLFSKGRPCSKSFWLCGLVFSQESGEALDSEYVPVRCLCCFARKLQKRIHGQKALPL